MCITALISLPVNEFVAENVKTIEVSLEYYVVLPSATLSFDRRVCLCFAVDVCIFSKFAVAESKKKRKHKKRNAMKQC